MATRAEDQAVGKTEAAADRTTAAEAGAKAGVGVGDHLGNTKSPALRWARRQDTVDLDGAVDSDRVVLEEQAEETFDLRSSHFLLKPHPTAMA
ncbi:MAG: hypothetical protein ACTHWA_01510 [Arachnia sp.]